MRLRNYLYLLHRYLGLSLGMLLALIGISGSLLVFDHALDKMITPQLRGVASGPSEDLQGLLEAAEAAVAPGLIANRIEFPRRAGSPYTVGFRGAEAERRRFEVNVDPQSHDILTAREWGDYPMSWLYRFHYTLLAGDIGRTVVGFLGLGMLVFCVSGLYLAWPRRGRWRYLLRLVRQAGARRFYWDVHRVLGLSIVPVLLLCAVTGVAMIFYNQANALVGSVAEVKSFPSYSVAPRSQRLPLDELVGIVEAQWPQGKIKRLYLPQNSTDSVRLSLNLPWEAWSNYGASSVWLDPYSGAVLGVWAAPQLPLGNRILAWVFPLHNADVLGLAGRWLWLVAGLGPALLFASGVYLWWSRRRRAGR